MRGRKFKQFNRICLYQGSAVNTPWYIQNENAIQTTGSCQRELIIIKIQGPRVMNFPAELHF